MRVGGRRGAIHQNGRLNRLFLTRRPHSVPLHLAQRQRADGTLGAALCQSFRSFRSGKTATKERAGEHSVGKRCRSREVKTKLLGLCRWSCRDGRPCEGILDLQRTSATTDRMAGFPEGGGALTTKQRCVDIDDDILSEFSRTYPRRPVWWGFWGILALSPESPSSQTSPIALSSFLSWSSHSPFSTAAPVI